MSQQCDTRPGSSSIGASPTMITCDGFIPCYEMPRSERRQKFEQALETGFTFVARDGVFEMRRRAETVDETVCEGIAE